MRNVKFHEERKQELIETAKRLFLEHGIEHTTISMIVGEIGVAHGLFYYYFKSKDEVIESVLESILYEFTNGLMERLEHSRDDFYDKIKLLMKALYEIYYNDTSNERPEDWIRMYYHDKVTKVLTDFGKGLIKEGIEKGYIQIPDAELVFNIAIGGCLLILEKECITYERLVSVVFRLLSLPYEKIVDNLSQ